MSKIILSWLGDADLRATTPGSTNSGPLLPGLHHDRFDEAIILINRPREDWQSYRQWLEERVETRLSWRSFDFESAIDFRAIYGAVTATLDELRARRPGAELTFHTSPGTSTMAAVWILLAKTRYPARLLQSSRDHGVSEMDVPFNLSAEFREDMKREAERDLIETMQAQVDASAAFDDILHGCVKMRQSIALAQRSAQFDVPVLLQGESGTGKELFARAIHETGRRGGEPFVAVNCGAIPRELVESELFGHAKGAFSGATSDRMGSFEAADGGTLFLDEIGEMPAEVQVRLLRVLQQGELVRVGENKVRNVDIRVISATHRNLYAEVHAGRFREDLFHRLAISIIGLPPLRERGGDLDPLIDAQMAFINEKFGGAASCAWEVTPDARQALHSHQWPGNVRELHNTLVRAALLAPAQRIDAQVVGQAILTGPSPALDLLRRPFDEDFDLNEVLDEVKELYIKRALTAATDPHKGVNKAQAARFLGTKRQNLDHWLQKLDS